MKIWKGMLAIAVLALGACQTRVPPAELDSPVEQKTLEVREGYAEKVREVSEPRGPFRCRFHR